MTAAKDDSIKAIVLRVDSPGGSALASDMMWHALEEAKAKKPVVVSMADVAASGGYYIACQCQQDRRRTEHDHRFDRRIYGQTESSKVFTTGSAFQMNI